MILEDPMKKNRWFMITIVQLETENIIKERKFVIMEQMYNSFACSTLVYIWSFFLQQQKMIIILINV
jgi:hypothetical protein